MSMATRFKLSFEIALISMLCSEALTGFSVKIDIDNLLVGRNLNLKIDRLHSNSPNMNEDTSKIIMRILFGNQLPIMNRQRKKSVAFTSNLNSF